MDAPTEDAWTREGTPFGTWSDGVDLVRHARVDDPTTDHRLAALAHDLDPLEAAWLAFAGHGASALVDVVDALRWTLRDEEAWAEIVWTSMDRVLRWAIYRRRQYVPADAFLAVLMEGACLAADENIDRTEAGEIDLYALRRAGQIESGVHTATVAAIVGVE